MAIQHSAASGESRLRLESTDVTPGLRSLFVIHGALQIGFGLALVVVPATLATLVGWGEPFDPVMSRLAGAFLVGLGLGQVLAYRARTWDQVWFLYVTVLVEALVGLVVVLYAQFTGALNAGWLLVPLFVVVTPAFLYYARYPLAAGRE